MRKTMGDIRKRYDEILERHKGSGSTYDVLVFTSGELERELVAYYSTPEGRAEIADSPHAALNVQDAVALLMQDVDGWAVRTLREKT